MGAATSARLVRQASDTWMMTSTRASNSDMHEELRVEMMVKSNHPTAAPTLFEVKKRKSTENIGETVQETDAVVKCHCAAWNAVQEAARLHVDGATDMELTRSRLACAPKRPRKGALQKPKQHRPCHATQTGTGIASLVWCWRIVPPLLNAYRTAPSSLPTEHLTNWFN
jgi:hypothetical protein